MKNINVSKVDWTETIKVLNKVGESSTEYYRSLLETKNPFNSIATKSLYNSIDHRVDIESYGFILWFIADDHMKYVEEGRYPYGNYDGASFSEWIKRTPPIGPIRKWMNAKGIPTSDGNDYKIARGIGKFGIKPKPYFSQTQKDALTHSPEIVNAITKDISNYIKSKVTKNKGVK